MTMNINKWNGLEYSKDFLERLLHWLYWRSIDIEAIERYLYMIRTTWFVLIFLCITRFYK